MPHLTMFLKAGPGAALILLFALLGPAAHAGDLDAATRSDAVTSLAEAMTNRYVFEDLGAQCGERLLADLEGGAFDDCDDRASLAQRLTDDLQEQTHDLHLRVRPAAPQPAQPTPEEKTRIERSQVEQMRAGNFGFEQVLRLPGNVGLVDLRAFSSADAGHDAAVGAMNFLGSSDALIFDLRQNGGGDPEMVQLISSWLFDEPTHLNSLWWRASEETVEFWTHDVPGKSLGDVPVFVLTSASTFSAAEEFTYNLKCLERATIVGETTGGGAHPGGGVDLPGSLSVFIPTGRAINPTTGTNWEGSGVAPDVECPADQALDRALELATRAASERRDERDGS